MDKTLKHLKRTLNKNLSIKTPACLLLLTISMSILSVFVGSGSSSAEAKPVGQAYRMPDTPFLPPFSGRIVSGETSAIPQTDGGIAYMITFETAEQPVQVLNWYKTAFQAYSWNIDAHEPAQFRISAQHGKNVATNIFLLSTKKSGASVQVQLYYRYAGREI